MSEHFVEIGSIDLIPFEILAIEKAAEEEEVPIFDLIMFFEEYNELFLRKATVEHIQNAAPKLLPETREALRGIYQSLEMYEYLEVLK